MPTPAPHLSLADLAAAGVRLLPVEAVTIARTLTLRAARAELRGIPSPHVVRLTAEGGIFIEGPVAAGASVERAVRLLESMLPGSNTPSSLRVPDPLRVVLARATTPSDPLSYPTLEDFAQALARFAAPDPHAAIRELVDRWYAAVAVDERSASAREADSLTISDVRRARRATGLRLAHISERTRIPVWQLRELEWGYFANWPEGDEGRAKLIDYARAAGLDEEVVLSATLPDLELAARSRQGAAAASTRVIVAEPERTLVPAPALPQRIAVRFGRERSRLLPALAIPALIAIALAPAVWQASDEPAPAAASIGEAAAGSVTAPSAPPAARPVPADGPVAMTVAARSPEPLRQADAVISEPPADAAPVARPASFSDDEVFSPAFASIGAATFHDEAAGEPDAASRMDGGGAAGATLRITSVVDDRSRNYHARPSPDGRFIAFDSDRDGERGVYIADANGENVRKVTGAGFAAVPSWSPDGRRLAYVRAEPGKPDVWHIWTHDLESGEAQQVTSHGTGTPWGAVWLPDGRRIAYTHEDRIVVRTLEGTDQQIYRSPVKGGHLRAPAVDPEGRRLVFQVRADGVWLLDLEDGTMRRILQDPTAEEFTWAPDGRRIAYYSRRTGRWGVWIMAPR